MTGFDVMRIWLALSALALALLGAVLQQRLLECSAGGERRVRVDWHVAAQCAETGSSSEGESGPVDRLR